jgi:predicted  nucleic acid-binding Zn-ribbon protein
MKYAWLSIAVLTMAACDGGKTQKITELQSQVAQLEASSAAKDSAVQEVAALTQMLGEINTEIASVKVKNPSSTPVVGGESPSKAQERERQNVVDRVRALADAVKSGEARLASARSRINALSKDNEGMKSTVSSLQASLDNLNQVVETQKTQIATLTAQVDSVKGENVKMVAMNEALTDTLKDVTDRANLVHYVVGTKDDLLKKGVVVEEGGTRFLFVFPRSGKTLAPARSLPVTEFQTADERQLSTLTLPDTAKYYKLVSRQDPSLLVADAADHGAFKGKVTISDPDKFWSASKYLILVEKP